jgi:hypothetical protein
VAAPVPAELRERFFEWLGGSPSMDPTTAAEPEAIAEEDSTPDSISPPTPAETETATSTALADAEEVTAEDLAADLVSRLAGLNQDLATALEAWKDLPAEGRRQLVEQVRWLAGALPYMEAQG